VLVTAAHCLDGKGYYLDHEIFRGRAGANVYQCSEDEDCPTVTIAGSPRPLLCEGQPQDWMESPAGTGECYLPELEYNNDALDAYFGESYDPYGLDHPANIIPIRYCHINPGYIVDPDDESQDFAYCILAEAPDVRPIPIMMHCEVDQFMNGDDDLDVMIAGFGVADVNQNTLEGRAGRKRWATSSTDGFAFDSADTVLSLAPFAPFVPGPASEGDSGGPVYVRLPPPHDSWRLFGVFGKSYFVAPPWQFVAWMLEDPEVEAILPCHDSGGDWQPGPACGGFPRSPQIGAGGWSNGPLACNNEDLSEPSSTCGPPFPSPLPPPPPRDPVITRPRSGGCATTDVGPGSWWSLLGLFAVVAMRRRRTPAAMLLALMLVVGCGPEAVEGSSGNETGNETGGQVEEPGPVEFNPEFRGVHSGLALPGTTHDQLAVGNVARSVDDTACCQDVVVGGPSSNVAEVFFGGGSVDHGFTFLDPRPTQHYEMANPGAGIRDLALVDLDVDGYNDLVAVTTDGQLGVRRGQAGGVDDVYFGPLALHDALVDELGRVAFGSLDCDDDLDVVITAPGGPGIVTLLQDEAGSFGPATFTATLPAQDADAAGSPVDVAVGEFDGHAPTEVVSVNDDGTATIYRREGCEVALASDSSMVFYSDVGGCPSEGSGYCLPDTRNARVVTDDIYCETERSDVTIAFADRARVYCNQLDYTADGFGPEHITHYWDINDQAPPLHAGVRGIAWWFETQTLYAYDTRQIYQLASPGTQHVNSTIPNLTFIQSQPGALEVQLARHTAPDNGWWQRVVWVGANETGAALGFAR
jgi:MYXO-CTERM domain-containing protein